MEYWIWSQRLKWPEWSSHLIRIPVGTSSTKRTYFMKDNNDIISTNCLLTVIIFNLYLKYQPSQKTTVSRIPNSIPCYVIHWFNSIYDQTYWYSQIMFTISKLAHTGDATELLSNVWAGVCRFNTVINQRQYDTYIDAFSRARVGFWWLDWPQGFELPINLI